jgi:AraC-like DNA-binding protein
MPEDLMTSTAIDPHRGEALAVRAHEHKLYKMGGAPFSLRRQTRDLGEFCVEKDELSQELRFYRRAHPDCLQFIVVEDAEPQAMISWAGSCADHVTRKKATVLSLTLSAERSAAVMTPQIDEALRAAMQGSFGPCSVRLRAPEVEQLTAALHNCLDGHSNSDAILTLAEQCLTRACDGAAEHWSLGTLRRRNIAIQTEDLLLKTKGDLGLDEVAKKLNCSRRLLQLALQQTFGIGFVSLKRFIRLHQLRHVLLKGEGGMLADLAVAHGFFHLGRFAKHYRDVFGVLPSRESTSR